jgi:hypothetical protein
MIAEPCCRQLSSAEQVVTNDLVDTEYHRLYTRGLSIEYHW